ncbi:hypothetical protein [Mesorhizobium sp. M8A.F.Ca.ET.021.01.1.1]|uniref:hypothetical protein n=1 Tax=Mesorhizobium sp. M8A.F.Ca.ET.021.01.1.1 TaxID=2496757 RepID=UPI000FCB914B|nr:hypothetical protein [Mesorhizobium sp. M8A.F.Ca.ET.021.01.1.1]RUW56723.1 hypothetical protein EOA36_02750 [Mesorhizobium sp. M8A.F.Ca.ET.021.01.1.1]
MKSIIDITWGRPKLEGGCVVVPFSMHCTDDVSPGDTPQSVYFEASNLTLTPKIVAKGQAEIEACIGRVMNDHRYDFGAISIGRLRESAIDYVRKHDLTVLVHSGWANADAYRPVHH